MLSNLFPMCMSGEQEWTHSWVNLCKVYKLFQQVTGVVKKTGEVVDDFNEDYKYLPENAGQDVSFKIICMEKQITNSSSIIMYF